MSVRESLVESAKKATASSCERAHVYIGVNDLWYETARQRSRTPLAERLGGLVPGRPSASFSELRGALREQLEAARTRRQEIAQRGEAIARDWRTAAAARDAAQLAKALNGSRKPSDLAASLRSWFNDFPFAEVVTAYPVGIAEASRKSAPRKAAPRKVAPRKTSSPATSE